MTYSLPRRGVRSPQTSESIMVDRSYERPLAFRLPGGSFELGKGYEQILDLMPLKRLADVMNDASAGYITGAILAGPRSKVVWAEGCTQWASVSNAMANASIAITSDFGLEPISNTNQLNRWVVVEANGDVAGATLSAMRFIDTLNDSELDRTTRLTFVSSFDSPSGRATLHHFSGTFAEYRQQHGPVDDPTLNPAALN